MFLLTSWSHVLKEAEAECASLRPSPDRVGFLLSRPAESLAAARWLFQDETIRAIVTPSRPSEMVIRFQAPSITLVDWQEFRHLRQMVDHANTVNIQPAGDHLSIELTFRDVWLEIPYPEQE